jgi:hypothetical protein
MTARKRNWIVAIGIVVALMAVGLTIAASVLAARLDPYARQTAISYLSQRFDSDVQIQALHLRLPGTSPLRLLLTRGRGITVRLEGQGLSMRLKARPDSVPLILIRKFRCDVSLDSLLHPPVVVSQVLVDGMKIQVPPRSERPRPTSSAGKEPGSQPSASNPLVTIGKLSIRRAVLVLQPRNPSRLPLRFDIQSLQFESGGAGAPMKYDASLTNPEPPGKIHATGTFGPWSAEEPAETPITGDYLFEKANLGVFAGIAGTLRSSGQFEGKLSAITARGQVSVPDFRLRMAGNPVPLFARFTVLVDATDGNTTLQPVTATLGSTHFTTSGGIVRHEANQPRAISLDVAMPNGNLRDVLRLAMKGTPFMEGRLVLNTKIDIPPLSAKVRQKLELDGQFEVREGKFLHSAIQERIDALSERAQGRPGNPNSDRVVSNMMGVFHLENAAIHFSKLSFAVPGADIDLSGNYVLDRDAIDFSGTLKLQATVSRLVTGWKRLALKPADRLFEKEGAGTFLRVRAEGTSRAPKFYVTFAGRQWEVAPSKR